ncbi:MAG: hypothetical protein RIG77_10685 [Cyclobacteriaceae bacterium]
MELDKDFKEFVELLNDNRVEYLVVGGYSVAHHGFPRYTGDFDIWINPTIENGKKMMKVLDDFGFGSLGIRPEDFTNPDKIVQFGVEPLRIDVLTAIDGIGDFKEAYRNKDESRYDLLKINFIGYRDLIENKKASNRLQDQRDVEELKKVKAKEKEK